MTRTVFEVKGLQEVQRRFKGMQGPALRRKLLPPLRAASKVVAEAIKAEAPTNRGKSPWQRYPKLRKRGGPMRLKITVRQLRARPGELAAVGVGPRTWYAHFVVKGTMPHVITASNAELGRASTKVVRVINKGGPMALHWGALYSAQVHHPGARANPFPDRAAHKQQGFLAHALAEALERSI